MTSPKLISELIPLRSTYSLLRVIVVYLLFSLTTSFDNVARV